MNLEALKSRHAQLISDRDKLVVQFNQMSANINVYNGAIQDCEYWIGQAETPATDTPDTLPASEEGCPAYLEGHPEQEATKAVENALVE